MNDASAMLWENERQNRRKILRGIFSGFLLVLIFLTGLSLWITQPIFPPAKKENNISIDPRRLKSHVEKLSLEFHPRNSANITNLEKTADYIKSEFEKAGGKTQEQIFQADGKEYRNILSSFGPDSAERIVIGAHYDSCLLTPGADDNASGIAGLIELAHLLGKENLNTQIELAAFTLEEPPYFASEKMGSYIHAKSLKERGAGVSLMISLEMIGYFSDEAGSQRYPLAPLGMLYPSRGNFISIVGPFGDISSVRNLKSAMAAGSDLPVYSSNVPSFINGVDFSDHRNYWNFGYNAIMITDTAFYRNFKYHTAEDTPERLDYERMAKVIAGIYNFIKEQK